MKGVNVKANTLQVGDHFLKPRGVYQVDRLLGNQIRAKLMKDVARETFKHRWIFLDPNEEVEKVQV